MAGQDTGRTGRERLDVRGRPGGRGRAAVAASILAALLIGAYVTSSVGAGAALPAGYLLNAAILAVAFWFPALRVGSVRDLVRQWKPLVIWLAAWTLVWDLATSGLFADREPFQEWWLVYPAGIGVLLAVLALHGAVAGRVARRGGAV